MKTFYARINMQVENGKFNDYMEFPTPEDEFKFLAVIPNPEKPCWKNWDALHKAGWHNNAKLNKDNFLEWEFPETPEEVLETMLREHDWYADYSDSYGIVLSGIRSWEKIQRQMKLVDPDVAKTLLEKYEPKQE